MIWYEDFVVGRTDRYGRYEVTREEVLDFAGKYDPQPFHLDDGAAAANPLFGRLAASGWHTAAMGMRMTADYWASLGGRSILGGAGIDQLRWLKPVHPGDTLHMRLEVLEARPLASRPEVGLVRSRWDVMNQHNDIVLTMEGYGMFRRREPAAP